MTEANSKPINDSQWEALVSLATRRIRPEKGYGVVTPWVDKFFPWNIVRRSPLIYSILIPLVLYLCTLVANLSDLDIGLAWDFGIPYLSIFFGLYFIYIVKDQYEKIYLDLTEFVTTEKSTFGRWYMEKISPLWGKVNLLDPEKRDEYSVIDLFRNDWLILSQFIFWCIFNGTIALFLLRDLTLPVEPSFKWALNALTAYFWAFSFMWTSHYIPASVIFLRKLKSLPVRYSFHIPDSMTLRRVGGRLVKLNWLFTLHYLCLLIILSSWGAFRPRVEEPAFTAVIVLCLLVGVVLYLVWIAMSVILPQIALSASMASYKRRFISEFYRHIENSGYEFMHSPNAENYEDLQEKAKYKSLFKKLPVLSLSRSGLISFLFLVIVNVGILVTFFFFTVGGIENLMDLLKPLI